MAAQPVRQRDPNSRVLLALARGDTLFLSHTRPSAASATASTHASNEGDASIASTASIKAVPRGSGGGGGDDAATTASPPPATLTTTHRRSVVRAAAAAAPSLADANLNAHLVVRAGVPSSPAATRVLAASTQSPPRGSGR